MWYRRHRQAQPAKMDLREQGEPDRRWRRTWLRLRPLSASPEEQGLIRARPPRTRAHPTWFHRRPRLQVFKELAEAMAGAYGRVERWRRITLCLHRLPWVEGQRLLVPDSAGEARAWGLPPTLVLRSHPQILPAAGPTQVQ